MQERHVLAVAETPVSKSSEEGATIATSNLNIFGPEMKVLL